MTDNEQVWTTLNIRSPILNNAYIARKLGMSAVKYHRKITGAKQTKPFSAGELIKIEEIIKESLSL